MVSDDETMSAYFILDFHFDDENTTNYENRVKEMNETIPNNRNKDAD